MTTSPGDAQPEDAAPGSSSPGAEPIPTPAAGWQRAVASVLVALFVVAAGLAVPTIWLRNQILDTSQFVESVAPLAGDAHIQDAVSHAIAQHLIAVVPTAATGETANEPDRALLTLAVSMAATSAVESVSRTVVASPQFARLWEETAGTAHAGFHALLTGGNSPFLVSARGQVAIDLTPAVDEVRGRLSARGIDVAPTGQDVQLVLFESERLAEIQSIVRVIDKLAAILPIVAIASLVGGVALSSDRRRTAIAAALGLAAMMALLLLVLGVLRWDYLRDLSGAVDREVARATFDILTGDLRSAIRAIGLVALIAAGIGVAVRSGALAQRRPVPGRVESTVAANRTAAIGILAAMAIILMLLPDTLPISRALAILAAAALGFFLIAQARPAAIEPGGDIDRRAFIARALDDMRHPHLDTGETAQIPSEPESGDYSAR
jgi:hypothetical protein